LAESSPRPADAGARAGGPSVLAVTTGTCAGALPVRLSGRLRDRPPRPLRGQRPAGGSQRRRPGARPRPGGEILVIRSRADRQGDEPALRRPAGPVLGSGTPWVCVPPRLSP